MAANEEELLRRFRDSGSRDALRDLLVAHQDRVYNACFQVLGRAEDAEDAAQEALLKLAEGARSARDGDSFRGWIYRVSFRIALDHWRRREAVKNRESRAAMNRPTAPPLDDRERVALFEAMDGLDDRERSLLLEHYFEKAPLADLGARRGISAVAIWKRIDHAREKLKRLLIGAGFVVASARVSEALEASISAIPSATLVGEAILSKALLGGLAMGAAKPVSMSLAWVLLAILLMVGGGYFIFKSGSEVQALRAGITTSAPNSAADHSSESRAPLDGKPVAAVPESAESNSPLVGTLARYKAWNAEWKRRASAWTPSDDREALQRFQREGWIGFKEAFGQINDDPAVFLKFIQDPVHSELAGSIFTNLLGKLESMGQGTGRNPQYFKDFSPELLDGLIAIVKSGTPELRKGILDFMSSVHDVPESYDALYEELMYDPDPWIQHLALYARWRQRSLDLPVLEKILARYQSSTDPTVQKTAIKAISYSPRPETFEWMLSSLENAQDTALAYRMACAAATMSRALSHQPETTERLIRSLVAAFERLSQENEQNWLLWSALHMPPKDSRRVLEAALPKATTPKLKAAIKFTLEKADQGSPTWNDLQNHFWRMMKN